MLSNEKSKRKYTGGLNHTIRRKKKKLSELRNNPSNPTITTGEERRKTLRVKGGAKKTIPLKLKFANIKLKDGKIVKGEVITEKANKANKDFIRRNILTKGAEVEVKVKDKTFLAKITSRPGQTGIVNAIEM
jgi:small subunit ribosomal protein S8e